MFDNLSTSIKESSEENLLAAAGEVKKLDTTKSSGNQNDDNDDNQNDDDDDDTGTTTKPAKKSTSKAKDKSTTIVPKKKEVTEISKNALEIAAGEEDDENNEEENENQEDDENNEEENNEENEENDNQPVSVSDFLKARVNLLIKKGEWLPLDGVDTDEIEWDEDTFAEIELKQREAQKDILRSEILDSFGPIGSTIAEYTANGGNPDDLIDIFKEQQKVENLSIETEEGQKAAMLKYAKEYLKMKPEKAVKYVDSLIADKELEGEAKEAVGIMTAELKAEAQRLKDEAEENVKNRKLQEKANIDKFVNDVNVVLNKNKDIPADEKAVLLKVLTKFDKKLQNGTPVNDFYFKFADFRKNTESYIDLVRFVMNPTKFMKTIERKGKNESAEKDFKLIRTSNKTKTAKSAGGEQNTTKPKTSGFKLLY